LKSRQEHPEEFTARFERCHRMLYFIACRVLGGSERAEEAVQNCRRTASGNLSRFEYEGVFRSWLLRVLIGEALAILGQEQKTDRPKVSSAPVSSEEYRWNPKGGVGATHVNAGG